jgi:hypothetical protein
MRVLFPFLLIFVISLLSCGTDPAELVADLNSAVVVKSTHADTEAQLAARDSYLVAFKSEAPVQSHYAGFFSEYQSHNAYLSQNYLSEPGVEAIQPFIF